MQYTVTLVGCGERYSCSPAETALGGMIRLGRRGIPVGCRGGGCGVCKVRVISGQYASDRLSRACVSEAEEAAGLTLACRIRPASDLQLEVVGVMRRRFGVVEGCVAGSDRR